MQDTYCLPFSSLMLVRWGFRIEKKVKSPADSGPKPFALTETCRERCVTWFLGSHPGIVSTVNSFQRKLKRCLMGLDLCIFFGPLVKYQNCSQLQGCWHPWQVELTV